MSEIETPIRGILQELTMEAGERQLDPFEAYIRFREELGKKSLHLTTYGSSAITSGGHARVHDLEIGDIIARNTDTAHDMCDELYKSGQLSPASTVEAVSLGKVRPWKQSDYMEFWLATMAGPKWDGVGVAQSIKELRSRFVTARDADEELDMEAYNSSQSPEERVPHYFRHAKVFAGSLDEETDPVKKIVQLVDPETSLGARTEKVFAQLIGARVFRATMARTGIVPRPGTLPLQLHKDYEQIIKFGGTTFSMDKREIAVLIPEEATTT